MLSIDSKMYVSQINKNILYYPNKKCKEGSCSTLFSAYKGFSIVEHKLEVNTNIDTFLGTLSEPTVPRLVPKNKIILRPSPRYNLYSKDNTSFENLKEPTPPWMMPTNHTLSSKTLFSQDASFHFDIKEFLIKSRIELLIKKYTKIQQTCSV